MTLWVLIPYGVVVPPSVKIATLSPAFWPKILAGGITVFGLLIALQGLLPMPKRGGGTGKGQSAKAKACGADAAQSGGKHGAIRAGAAILGMLAYYFMVEPLGIILASMVIFPVFAMLYGEKRIKLLAPLGILLPVGLYYFFTVAAHKPMPTGYFF